MPATARKERRAYLLELLNRTLVDTSALVDQVCVPCEFLVSASIRRRGGLRPVVVDLPESTWPITTTLMCIFSLLRRPLARCDDVVAMQRSRLPVLTHPMMAVVDDVF